MAVQSHDHERIAPPPEKAEPSTGVVVRLDIPPDHHPAVIKGDSPGAQLGREALTGIYDANGKINDTAAQVRDKGRLASAALPFAERAVQQAGRAINTLQQQAQHLDREIAQMLTHQPSSPQATEVRGYWQARSPGTNRGAE